MSNLQPLMASRPIVLRRYVAGEVVLAFRHPTGETHGSSCAPPGLGSFAPLRLAQTPHLLIE